jgi:U3 small nucleolar RNA-associated protein 4
MDTQSNRCTCRISLDKTDNEHTLVWKLKCLRDGTIVSSDSNGKVTIWEGKYGTMKQVIHVHVADVLALAVNEAEDVMFAAGVDHKILRLKKVADEDNGGVKWVQADVIRPHSHDVKSLAVSNNGILASGGVDTELCLNLIDQFHMTPTLRHSPFTSWYDCFKLAHSANYLMFQGATSLKLWKIFPKASSDRSTSCSPDKDAIRKSLGVIDEATTCNDDENLPLFFLEVKAAPAHHIISSGLSSRGNLLAFSNVEQVWLYKMNDVGVVCLGVWSLPASAIAVNSEGDSIVLCLISGGMQMASLGGSKVDFVPLLIKPEKTKKNSALFLKAQYSPCDNYLIVMDNEYRFYLYSTSDYTVIAGLPCFDSNFPPSITFNSKELLIFSSCYGELYCYDIEEAALHGCGRIRRSKSRSKRRSLHMTKGLYAVPSRSNICVLYDFDSLMAVKWDRKKSEEDPRIGDKRKKTDSSGFISHDLMVGYQDIIFAGGFQNGEMVVVEKLWSDVISQLPSTICIDRYGT